MVSKKIVENAQDSNLIIILLFILLLVIIGILIYIFMKNQKVINDEKELKEEDENENDDKNDENDDKNDKNDENEKEEIEGDIHNNHYTILVKNKHHRNWRNNDRKYYKSDKCYRVRRNMHERNYNPELRRNKYDDVYGKCKNASPMCRNFAKCTLNNSFKSGCSAKKKSSEWGCPSECCSR